MQEAGSLPLYLESFISPSGQETGGALAMVLSRPKDDPEEPPGYQFIYREKGLKAIKKSLEYGERPVRSTVIFLNEKRSLND